MKSLNVGILAHVDAGKTSLTERLLYDAGVIQTLGSVDQGNTQTDTLALERQRGITIKAAVTSFTVGGLKFNLIDTPGHPDFIAEVERSLRVLDAAVLVVSAVEGVQPQTRVLMRALQRLHMPTVLFINKIDRMGARGTELIADIRHKLFAHVIAMNAVAGVGTRDVQVIGRDPAVLAEELEYLLADNSGLFLNALINNPQGLTQEARDQELITQIQRMQLCPVLFGSAIKGVGASEFITAFQTYFVPPQVDKEMLSAVIFKIERGTRGEKVAYARMYGGELHAHSQVLGGRPKTGETFTAKITGMQTFENGVAAGASCAYAGDIVKLWGLNDCAIDDYLGRPPGGERKPLLVKPSLEVVVVPDVSEDAPRLYIALQQISEQDPFIEVHQNAHDKALSVQLCGEVQKEVIADTLVNDYDIRVGFHDTQAICIERPIGIGEGIEIGDKDDPYKGTVGLRIEPGPLGSGLQYRLASSVLGTMPAAFFVAIEEAVGETLHEGLYGWQVTDCIVTLVRIGYWPRQSHAHARFDKSMSSTAGDFRIALTPLALMQALRRAGTNVYEPMNKFELEVPQAVFTKVMQTLIDKEARLRHAPILTKEYARLEGSMPVRRTFEFERLVPDLTGGEGTFIAEFGDYQAVQGMAPNRERTDNNPLDRRKYLRRTFNRQ